ncbi:hypothetical protein B0H34DRAFT_796844 [Crassisporium funariophilum]|nr:hypothetical protein B0H34DRAFT_796844 [Crassisporium funariophilum]
MDDPWANAWGEPSKSAAHDPSLASSSTWSAPSVSVIHGDHEDDISIPSWSVEPPTQWNEPNVAEASLWGNDSQSKLDWDTGQSSFGAILSKVSVPELRTSSPTLSSEDPQNSVPSSPTSSLKDEDPPPRSPSLRPQSPPPLTLSFSPSPLSLSAPGSPDPFGTFETAGDVQDSEAGSWSIAEPNYALPSADANAWGSSWQGPDSSSTVEEKTDDTDDAWETARQEKERQDRHVPPELLASILRQLEEISNDLWPSTDTSTANVSANEGSIDFGSLGLDSVMQRLVPEDMTLPANIQFSKTFVSKQMIEALKLTKYSPSTRLSPMAMYMTSKGSTSWEAAIKSRPTFVQEDSIPAGWKIVEAAKEDATSTDDGKKKAGGGLLSFFGRRATNPAPDATRRSASPVTTTAISSSGAGSSPKPSIDSVRSANPTQKQVSGRVTPSSPIVPSSSTPTATQQNDSMQVSSASINMPRLSSESIASEPTPPPSAVSRFLGRFSTRTKSSNPQDPLALSADDLEFLSDVPTVQQVSGKGADLDALSLMIRSSPLPTVLPPPLAPPPRAPLQPPPATSRVLQVETPHSQQQQHDPFSFFDAPYPETKTKAAPAPPLQHLTAAPTPPARPISSSSVNLSLPPPPSNGASFTASAGQNSLDSEELWPSFDYPAPMVKVPIAQKNRTFVPIMKSSSSTSTPPPLLAKPPSAFPMPPQVTSSLNHRAASNGPAAGSSIMISPIPPPPSSRSHTPFRAVGQVNQPAQPIITSFDEDDDFSDFLSSPAETTPPAHTSFSSFTSAGTSSTKVLTSNDHAPPLDSFFESFDDFASASHSNPTPPRPPAKPLNFAFTSNSSVSRPQPPIASSFSPPPSQGSPPSRKIHRKADHSRTLSLMETAAARGRWLGPPSPLPEALAPPGGSNGNSSQQDSYGGGSTMQAQQAQAAATLAASFSSPALTSNGPGAKMNQTWNLPPPNPTLLQPALPSQYSHSGFKGDFQPQSSRQLSTMNSGTTTPAEVKTGGLSAQDLSFFEGL